MQQKSKISSNPSMSRFPSSIRIPNVIRIRFPIPSRIGVCMKLETSRVGVGVKF